MKTLLWLSLFRHFVRHPWQLALTILGIALGVAVVLAVDLANTSARKSFALSMEQVTGRTTHRIVGGARGVPEALYARLRVNLGLREAAPIVTGYATVSDEPGKKLQILGVDVFAEGPFRGYLAPPSKDNGSIAALLTKPYSALLPPELGFQVALQTGKNKVTLRSAGQLDKALQGLIVTDISTAQALFDKQGWLSHIDLIIPEGTAGEPLLNAVQTMLTPDLKLERPAERNRVTSELSSAFSLNLTALSLLALLVGSFLIYNTMTFAVVQRRPLLGMLRALGVSNREILTIVLVETLLLGLAGILSGGLLGIALGSGLVHLVTRTIDDLYYALSVREFFISPFSLLKAAALGLLATLLAAWLPAREAAAISPASALSRAHLEGRWRTALPRLNRAGLTLLTAGGLTLLLSGELVAGFTGLFLLIFGCALLTPTCLVLVTRLNLGIHLGLLARMATRDVARHLSRTGVAVAALMVAFATTVGVGLMVDSFRGGVRLWISDLINADIYIAPLARENGDSSASLRPELLTTLHSLPGVAAVSTYWHTQVDIDGKPVLLVAADLAPVSKSGYHLIDGEPEAAWKAFDAGEALLISESLAYRRGLKAGAALILPTGEGPHSFPIAGVFLDYGSEHGRILLHQRAYQRLWNDSTVSSAAIFALPEVDVNQLRHSLEGSIGRLQALLMRSNRDIQRFTLDVFDRTFTITNVLRFLAIVVAFIGVLSALMALQLERAREFAVLRATGMTPTEIGWLVSLETGFMGLIAGGLAIPTGLLLAGVLILVINRRAFGWTLPFQIDPWILFQSLALAVGAALLAGVYPLWRMTRSHPAQALRSE